MSPSSPSEEFFTNNTESDMDMGESPFTLQHDNVPSKIRKKPGRKPNPASPALRKAQNRAAQRAFRERKERRLRELETSVKEMREERDRLHTENEQFKGELEVLRNENWYMKGMLLSMQLVCFRYGLALPQHSPHLNEEELALLSNIVPEPIAAYIQANANNRPPPSIKGSNHHQQSQPLNHRKIRERFISKGSLFVTKDDIRTHAQGSFNFDFPSEEPKIDLSTALPAVSPKPSKTSFGSSFRNNDEDSVTSNITAIQTLRLRLRLQSACAQMDSRPFTIHPTPLQLTIPHDPRIDLVPTGAMRDRMILFRDLFDIDDCFRCIISEATFLGGDPTSSSSWQLTPEFFDKYWFLTTDYTTKRMINRWQSIPTLQPLPEINDLTFSGPCSQREQTSPSADSSPLASDVSSRSSVSSTSNDLFIPSPIQLTKEGYVPHKPFSSTEQQRLGVTTDPHDNEYDLMIDCLIDTEHV